MTTTTYREAIRAAIREALHRDNRVFLMGEDVGRYGNCFGGSLGLLEEFGPERVRWSASVAVDRPWSVNGPLGVRPVVTVSLAADHRATDGATEARYLQTVTRLLRKPEEL